MHIQLESADHLTIQSYQDHQITVQGNVYKKSLIISPDHLTPSWPIHSLEALSEVTLEPILTFNPEIIIIGHQKSSVSLPSQILPYLSKKRIGIEIMSIGAACRTFNVLLSEKRKVVIGLIFSGSL